MQKIIGLDIGSYSIKAVEILNKFKTYEIANFYENQIPNLDEVPADSVIPICMEQLFKENNLQADRIITAMPGQYISSRILSFGFSEPHKIAAAVYGEIEDAVPFDLQDMIVDHQIIGKVENKTVALIAMTKKIFLASFLEHLQRINIDPKLVDVDSLSFYNLCPHLEMQPGKCYGLVDVGHEKTSVCLVQDGVLRMFRSINLGGRYITDFLARDLEIGFNDAQRIKHEVSRVLTLDEREGSNKNEESRVAERITVAANTIIKDLGRTLYAFKTWEKSPIEKIFLSGGTSVIKNFDTYLSEHLDIETVPNRLEESTLKVNPDITHHMPIMAQGISIGLRAVSSVKRHSQINLRKGEYAYVQDYESIFKIATLVFKSISVILLLLAISYMAKYFSYTKQIENLQATYKTEFLKVLGSAEKNKYKTDKVRFNKIHEDAKARLGERINAKRLAITDFMTNNGDSGALLSLAQISSALPAEIRINVVEFRYKNNPDATGKITLRIEADSFDTIAKFETALKGISSLSEVVEKSSDAKPGSDIKIAVIEAKYSNNPQDRKS